MISAKRQRVVCGMSGGVDSSAAAALLLEQGYEVVGITLKLWPQDCVYRAEDKCCGPQAVTDARAVCHKLGIPYYLIDEAAEFQKHVIEYFADEYKAGRTPNPCVMCNQNLKFGRLISRADQLGADYVATGHFARIESSAAKTVTHDAVPSPLQSDGWEKGQGKGKVEAGRHLLKRGRDLRKDQSYFLFSLRQDQLARALFPLGEKTKSDTREVARHCRLKTADKEESMEICFVPDNDYGGFLRQADSPKSIVAKSRTFTGGSSATMTASSSTPSASGAASASPPPSRSCRRADAEHRVIVGDETMLDRDGFTATHCNWIPFDKLAGPIEVTAKILYSHPARRRR